MAQAPTTAYSSSQPTRQQPGQQQQQRPTGQRARQRKMSDYGRQLAEKQKARREYGLREKQFRRYFERAMKSSVTTGQALFADLERRLDNVVFRSGLAKSRAMGRQLVGHGLILVNGIRIDAPSYPVKEGDVITLKKTDPFPYNDEAIVPNWMSVDKKKQAATIDRLPRAEDLQSDINAQLIIEYYSR